MSAQSDLSLPGPTVIAEDAYWTMRVNDNQATLGRVFFALKRPETDALNLTADEHAALWRFLTDAKSALTTLFAPDHFNYMALMNLTPQVHWHIFPRYQLPREFAGQTFTDGEWGGHYNPARTVTLDDATQGALVAALLSAMAGRRP